LDDRLRIASQPFAEIDASVSTERRDQLACACVARLEVRARGEQRAPVRTVPALPVVDAAVGDVTLEKGILLVLPELLAGQRVDGDDGSVVAKGLHRGVDGERVEAPPTA